ncbi:unnamed protein product [Nippostrongylus brasiliensis]|uniref:Transposase n=1 Tax=Nippostrongylus brasiliensis TaxID=27835 RepID=A0A158R2R3_NIPBR|nr:unnamed protein product [Nippostrongylus brasiliensis]
MLIASRHDSFQPEPIRRRRLAIVTEGDSNFAAAAQPYSISGAFWRLLTMALSPPARAGQRFGDLETATIFQEEIPLWFTQLSEQGGRKKPTGEVMDVDE